MTSTEAGEQFHRQAAKYAVSEAHSTGESLRILTAWAALGRHTLGLDIATGPGFTAFAIAEFCDTIVASDIAPGMLNQARKIAARRGIANVRFEIIDASDIPYPDASVDLVTCRTAPHHFRDIGKFLSEVHRVLRPGASFCCAIRPHRRTPPSLRGIIVWKWRGIPRTQRRQHRLSGAGT